MQMVPVMPDEDQMARGLLFPGIFGRIKACHSICTTSHSIKPAKMPPNAAHLMAALEQDAANMRKTVARSGGRSCQHAQSIIWFYP
ncbi:hypothetical protein [Rhizobium alvei]|uniref:Uncharacterized protein n=1 Tax=Rhizobium alvei TaxID=1132659 RepID=A0ABT8YPR4_9HYPH|nr:hypothetical protein [Rhizobium alvei]MDO6965713.1 hypothetical protein [Rhizobium alvei]